MLLLRASVILFKFSNLDKAILRNHLLDQCFDCVGSCAALGGGGLLLLDSDTEHVSYMLFENIRLLAIS